MSKKRKRIENKRTVSVWLESAMVIIVWVRVVRCGLDC